MTPCRVVPTTLACMRAIRAIIDSAALRGPYTVVMAANPVRRRRPIGSFLNEECSQMPVRIEGSASSMMTAVTPPTNSAIGFLNRRQDTEFGESNAASPRGVVKSTRRYCGGFNKESAQR